MNRLAKENKGFVFIINYEANGAYIAETCDIDPTELLCSFPSFNNVPTNKSYDQEAVEWHIEALTREEYEPHLPTFKGVISLLDEGKVRLFLSRNICSYQ